MFSRTFRGLNQFFQRTRTINNEPLNGVSLIVIILIDIFILVNVFSGLDDISRWHLSPDQAFPCYSEWQGYRNQDTKDKDYEITRQALTQADNQYAPKQNNFQQAYEQGAVGHLGTISKICLKYAKAKDKIDTADNQKAIKTIDQKQNKITTLEQANRNIRAQYDSTLLEKIAGQKGGKSINTVNAEKAKETAERNNREMGVLRNEMSTLKKALIAKPESTGFLAILKNENQFSELEKDYKQASFWYPSIRLGFQSLFLLPLLLVAFSLYKFAQRKNYGLVALICLHLLIIFFIPLIFKVFEFLQVGALFQFIFDLVITLFGGLLFVINYLYILLIPLVGFGIIKFVQTVILNPKIQAANRVQASRCINCAKKIGQQDAHCPHCGFYQYMECQNCHQLTYKNLLYCKQCGHSHED
jgi:predicted RNA-binding Zn-ribbon protein involved in translation (DUF1610 family)